jgi:hypothetical protein
MDIYGSLTQRQTGLSAVALEHFSLDALIDQIQGIAKLT